MDQASESIPGDAADAEAGFGGVGESGEREVIERRMEMESAVGTRSIAIQRKMERSVGQVRTGWGLSGLLAAFFVFDAVSKLAKPAPVVQAFTQSGWPIETAAPIGIILLACTVLFLIRRTA